MQLKPPSPGVALAKALDLTHKRFLSSMSRLVSVEMALCDELLIADLTNKRPSVLVESGAHMSLEISSFAEFLVTIVERAKEHLGL